MAWYTCIKSNQYTGKDVFHTGKHYELTPTPPTEFFTADLVGLSAFRTRPDAEHHAETDADGVMHIYDEQIFENDITFADDVFFDNIAGTAGIQKHTAWNSGNGLIVWNAPYAVTTGATTITYQGGVVRFTDGDSEDPQLSYVSFDGAVDAIDTLVTDLRTFWAVGRDGLVYQFADRITPAQKRDYIQIIVTAHSLIDEIAATVPSPEIGYELGNKLNDLQDAIRIVNFNGGNTYTAAASGNKLQKTSGECWANTGRNFAADPSSPSVALSAEIASNEGLAPAGFPLLFDAWRDGAGSTVAAPNISGTLDVTKVDDGSGTLATLPDGYWVTDRIYLEPAQNITTRIHGQVAHKGKDTALGVINREDFNPPPAVTELILRGAITYMKGVDFQTSPNDIVFSRADKYGTIIVNSLGGSEVDTPSKESAFFTSRGLPAGTSWLFGFYHWPTTDITLTQASLTLTWGTANVGYGARPSIVSGGPGTVDAGVVGLRVTGTTITDDGVRTPGDTQILSEDITALTLDQYCEPTKKFIGQVVYELYTVSGSPVNYSLTFNYGWSKYSDKDNTDHMLTSIEAVGEGAANDTDAQIVLYKHSPDSWQYSASGFTPGNGIITSASTIYVNEDNVGNGEGYAFKRTGLDTFIRGSVDEGYIVKIVTTANNTFQLLNVNIGVQF